jgi:nucleotide-binding universal stress UspA family protein
MTAIETTPSESSLSKVEHGTVKPTIVVATDGSAASAAAFKAASLIAGINDLNIRVVAVLEPLQIPAAIPHAILNFEGSDSTRIKQFVADVQSQIEKCKSQSAEWVIEPRVGIPAAEISQAAREHSAGLVIVGASRHGLFERLIGEETAARVAQLGDTPLLVAATGLEQLPHRVVIAMDLDPSQLGDLRSVLSMFGPAASVTCVHVQRREDFPGSDSPAFARAYESAVTEAFDVVKEEISGVPGMRADLIRLHGDPATELLRYCDFAKAELLVLGLRRHYGLRRLLGGGVALNVLRGATCSVLIVPESAPLAPSGDAISRGKDTTLTSYVPDMWPSQLKQFTERNAGRRATLEVNGPDIGAFVEVAELPFIGADYDHRDGRVEILLGDFIGSDRHFSRSIPSPDSVSVLRGSDMKDDVLCISYGDGQTLLTFTT